MKQAIIIAVTVALGIVIANLIWELNNPLSALLHNAIDLLEGLDVSPGA